MADLSRLLTLDEETIPAELLRLAAIAGGNIIATPTSEGLLIRIGPSTVECGARSSQIQGAIEALLEDEFLFSESDEEFWVTDEGFIASHPKIAGMLDSLLTVSLTSEKVWEKSFASLPPLERGETLDAFSQGGLPLVQLIWEWAGTYGQISPLQKEAFDADLTEFWDALAHLSLIVPLEISVAHYGHPFPVLPPFAGQRVKVVNRSIWFPFRDGSANNLLSDDGQHAWNEVSDVETDKIPSLTDPAKLVGNQRVGETWIRIHPDWVREGKREPLRYLHYAQCVSDRRVSQLREALADKEFREDESEALNEQLSHITGWQRLLHVSTEALSLIPARDREEKAVGLLAILRNFDPNAPENAQPQGVTSETKRAEREPAESYQRELLRLGSKLPRWVYISFLIASALLCSTYLIWDTFPDDIKSRIIQALVPLQLD